jgi:hypothetical protein
MEERRTGGSWLEKMERFLGMQPPDWSARIWIILACGFAVVALFGALALFFGFDSVENPLEVALLLSLVAQSVRSIGEALYAGAFGGRLVERGRVLRVVGVLALTVAVFVGVVDRLGPESRRCGGRGFGRGSDNRAHPLLQRTSAVAGLVTPPTG